MRKFRLNCALVVALCLVASIAGADTLKLKNGSLIHGKFLGGTESEISFQVGSSVQKYNITDIVSLEFDSQGIASDKPASSASDKPGAPESGKPAAPESSLPDAPETVKQDEISTSGKVTIPAGTRISVRTLDVIDTTEKQAGDPFQASLVEPLVVEGNVIVAKDADVYGRLIESRESGTFTGRSQLRLELTGIVVNGRTVRVVTEEYDMTGKSRGASTAERTVTGAALGSIIGAAAGGGEGAAIGAGVGAAAGAGSQTITKGDQIRVPSETLLEFTLQQDVSVPVHPI
jgi:hypothetical protein